MSDTLLTVWLCRYILLSMDDALLTDGPDADEMLSGLESDLAALVAAGELDADDAAEMQSWLGSPFAA